MSKSKAKRLNEMSEANPGMAACLAEDMEHIHPKTIQGNASHNLCVGLFQELGDTRASINSLLDEIAEAVLWVASQQQRIYAASVANGGVSAEAAHELYESQLELNRKLVNKWRAVEGRFSNARWHAKLVRKVTLHSGKLVTAILMVAGVKLD